MVSTSAQSPTVARTAPDAHGAEQVNRCPRDAYALGGIEIGNAAQGVAGDCPARPLPAGPEGSTRYGNGSQVGVAGPWPAGFAVAKSAAGMSG
ncbi:hypothetical protein ACFWY9_42905 [Amycolatopsis sp. NPDC059027]|uniref:hypothetical protein n=1 Tax=unclassified Amycolatopsis TaxID=2618356 RepID=UPI00366F555C